MLDRLRGILLGIDYRRVDLSMFVIEALVLLLIFLDLAARSISALSRWRELRYRQRLINVDLDSIAESLANSLCDHILQDMRPSDPVGSGLWNKSRIGIVERDYTGWKWCDESKPLVRKWAKKRARTRSDVDPRIKKLAR